MATIETVEKVAKTKRGGKRANSGRKILFNEVTSTYAFRCPVSKIEELKKVIKGMLFEWQIK